MSVTTRKDDELTLEILRQHFHTSMTHEQIAAEHRMTKTAVTRRIKRVRDADTAHDPEAAPYWAKKGTST